MNEHTDRKAVHEAAAMLGRIGGSKTSPAKARACRKNAQRAGRPRKDGTPPISRQD